MKAWLATIVKRFSFLRRIYRVIIGSSIKLLRTFVKTDDKLILINSFGGKKYDDSPKALFEEMRKDKRFEGYRVVWAFHEPSKHNVEGAEKIKTDTFKYFKTALQARCWITNSAIERGLGFKGRKTFYFNTWHGTPIKKMGSDELEHKNVTKKTVESRVDVMTAQSDFEADIFSRVFNIPREHFLMCGLPRNDSLVNYTAEERDEIRKKLGLPADKKVILYAPTFREYERDIAQNCVLAPPMNLSKWEEELRDNYCLLFRAHYEVSKVMQVLDNDFVKNMTSYPNLSDLMIAADILISDYSSIIFDFSVMDKVMLHFTYDYEKYSTLRGMYFDIRDSINGADNEEKVIEILKNLDYEKEKEKVFKFRDKYLNYYGKAAKSSLDCIIKNIGE